MKRGSYELCRACGFPISAEDMQSKAYAFGISCHHCVDRSSPEQKERFRERIKQIELSRAKGKLHLKAQELAEEGSRATGK
jgi:UPF0176 protein